MRKNRAGAPSRAAVAARPTMLSDNILADRSIRQNIDSNDQILPIDDKRYRITTSAKFYIVQLMGSWLHIDEAAERTIKHGSGLRKVRFENKDYELRRATDFQPFVSRFLHFGCYARIGGITVDSEKDMKKILPQKFIYVASSAAWEIFETMREEKRKGR